VLPITLDTTIMRVGLAGEGEGLERRRRLLAGTDIAPVAVAPSADGAALGGLNVLFVAGLSPSVSAILAARAREAGVLVNVEDVPELCDFHVPAVVRRGELIFTVSTSGRAPGLARRLREWLEQAFGPEWRGHLDDVATVRAEWRAEGHAPGEVSRRTRNYVAEKGWL
jgi:precorrin-2 dehydrogenase/sirohydrochlorin ferrochelatase